MNRTINRRQFVVLSVTGACAACLGHRAVADATMTVVDAGAVSALPEGALIEKWRKSHKFVLVREEKKLFAVSARCTHKGALLDVESDHFFCPGHGSVFDRQGIPTDGPALAPLARLGVRVDRRGHLLVDAAVRFARKDWDKPGAFVEI
jgi:nitrite reductase/ring-hydroxylating ferredoxin subunit